ncbi:MAG: DUF1905 domain-containing protein [Absicoccus sp.]|uniref:DUF1905 domain-containing protein n=1 Tax=Absicoccus intestinalis TaxID=2926319 RepID=A0ABU4WKN1_9FIRM|nr:MULTISPECIES: DUF1905 domain-containing protein [Absicoccus]MDD6459407.1 DUF1905 domain-containing protein [Absicoccus porci]MDX8417108.1 DUF1905 domain-containing protein [Absicoccus sp. CLA-KB-P134]MDY3035566.1 DUF1905 domain-containing protein [Absicoccus sp.]
MKEKYEFDAIIEPVKEKGGAYVRVPIDLRSEFGKGRIKVHATFNGVAYNGSVVNMGIKNEDGSICYIIGVRKDIQKQMGKGIGDRIHVALIPIV